MVDGDRSPTEAQVTRWKAGDASALELLCPRISPLLEIRVQRHRSWSLLPPHITADDVVQEVWTRVFSQGPDAFESTGPGSFRRYLGVITDHTLIDIARRVTASKRGGRETRIELDTRCEREWSEQGGSETPTSNARASELMEIARSTLAPREREVWELIEYEGLDSEDVGLALGCSGSAVRSVFKRARNKLARRITQI